MSSDSTVTPDDPVLPAGFRFGTATAAAQVEGAADADGRGPSIWDVFAAEPGRIRGGDTPAVACDHYHRFREDAAMLGELGVDEYRFSISWSRVLPHGLRGTGDAGVNRAGLDFYSRLVDALLEADVRPVPTLYHWDLPQALQEPTPRGPGGWLDRATSDALGDYAALMGETLGDRVSRWLTLNEMNVHTLYGHALTDHAPALGMGLDCLPVAHNLLRAHGLAVDALRASVRPSDGSPVEVGVVQQHFPVLPATDSEEDAGAADLFRILTNWLFSDPILRGAYPEDWVAEMVAAAAGLTPDQLAADLAVISRPLDLYGVNYYEPTMIEAPRPGKDYSGVLEVDIPADMPFSPVRIEGPERTDFDWPVIPSGLRDVLVTLHERYPGLPPVTITENGCSYHDEPDADGRVRDDRRIAFHRAHLAAVAEAIDAGVDVRGYYVWSALDNFEWAAGYVERFGLVHVDRATLERTRKDSWYWYRDLIAAHRARG